MIFVGDWSLRALFNMDYTYESSFLNRRKNAGGLGYRTPREARVENTFEQRYPAFLVGHTRCNISVGILLPGLSTLDKWYALGLFYHIMNCREIPTMSTSIFLKKYVWI